MTSVPAAFQLTVVDGREWLSFKTASDGGEKSAVRGGWAVIHALELAPPGDVGGPAEAGAEGAASGRAATGGRGTAAHLRTRRLAFKQAVLSTSAARLQEALSWCPLAESGLSDVRVWTGPGGLRLAGRFAAGGLEAPFTIRVAVEPRSDGRRRLRLGFSDVRVFGPLPVPSPLIGSAVSHALASGAPPASAVRFGIREAKHAALELDPLEVVLTTELVSQGWRLPDLTRAWLQSVAQSDGTAELRFASDGYPTDRLATLEPGTELPPLVWLEGERVAEDLAAGDNFLFAREWAAAEAEYRKVLRAAPQDLAAQARLLAVRAISPDHGAAAEVVALSDALMASRPDFVPAILHAAIAASQAGDTQRAATLFAQVETLTAERGETEDALLARAAASAAADRSGPTVNVAAIPANIPAAASGSVTAKTTAVYAEGDPDRRADALGEMLQGFEQLVPERQHAAYASFGRVAEATGDLEYAEEAYWRATSVAADPAGRADDLMAHARVLLSRGNLAAAIAELEEALVLAPDHIGMLVLLAEQAMDAEDWERARGLYALLDRTPGADHAIPRHTLLLRRGRLARGAGDASEAESCYRDLAALDPKQVEARQVLAEIALERHDLSAAAERLEEVLELLPLDALDALLDARQHLGEIHAGMGDWRAARPYVELVLAQNPRHIPMLERSAQIYENLGLPAAAAETFSRLARIHAPPRARAEALWRAGEIWQDRLGDEPRAFDAYLKASDLDPTHGPTALRLIDGYWRRGQFAEVVEVASDARRTNSLPEMDSTHCLRVAIASALARGGGERGAPARVTTAHGDGDDDEAASALLRHPWDIEEAARLFTETAVNLAGQPPAQIAPAVAVLAQWRRAANPAAPSAAAEQADQQDQHDQLDQLDQLDQKEETLEKLWALLSERLLADPGAAPAGMAAALAWIATRQQGGGS